MDQTWKQVTCGAGIMFSGQWLMFSFPASEVPPVIRDSHSERRSRISTVVHYCTEYSREMTTTKCHARPFSSWCSCIPPHLIYTCILLLLKVYFPFYWTFHVVNVLMTECTFRAKFVFNFFLIIVIRGKCVCMSVHICGKRLFFSLHRNKSCSNRLTLDNDQLEHYLGYKTGSLMDREVLMVLLGSCLIVFSWWSQKMWPVKKVILKWPVWLGLCSTILSDHARLKYI